MSGAVEVVVEVEVVVLLAVAVAVASGRPTRGRGVPSVERRYYAFCRDDWLMKYVLAQASR
jgi:hypothetical protein